MRLRFARRTDYAIRAAVELARHEGLVKRRAIADATGAPSSVAAQALADLVREGLAHAVAGPAGGYRLGRPAETITVLDVVEAVEPTPPSPRCVLYDDACSHVGKCPFHDTIAEAREAFVARLAADTLADVAARLPLPASR